MSFHNDCAYLKFHKQSLKGIVKDYQISFNEEQMTIENIIPLTLDLFRLLLESLTDCVQVRLVAKVNFTHINHMTDESEERSYHFSSYKREYVKEDVAAFYERHMLKIAERLNIFNRNGSNLLIKNIPHIHIQCTTL